MKADKIFYATWGLVIIMAGICAIIGLRLQLDLWSIVMVWLICVGIILIAAGFVTLSSDRKTAILQILVGELCMTITLGVLAIYLHVLDIYLTFALISIIVGVSVIAVGMSRKG